MPQPMQYTRCESSLGGIYVAWTAHGIACLSAEEQSDLEFLARCRAYTGQHPVRDDSRQAAFQAALQAWLESGRYDGAIDLTHLSPFAQEVLRVCREIPRGETRSYGDLAEAIGKPGATRAVGSALRRNPVPLLIPCHRVVRKDGVIGQFNMGGPEVKLRLLQLEGAR